MTQAPPEFKLAILYAIDSILKNTRSAPYEALFAPIVVPMVMDAFYKVCCCVSWKQTLVLHSDSCIYTYFRADAVPAPAKGGELGENLARSATVPRGVAPAGARPRDGAACCPCI
jgi:hypothetical protein